MLRGSLTWDLHEGRGGTSDSGKRNVRQEDRSEEPQRDRCGRYTQEGLMSIVRWRQTGGGWRGKGCRVGRLVPDRGRNTSGPPGSHSEHTKEVQPQSDTPGKGDDGSRPRTRFSSVPLQDSDSVDP